MSRGLGKLQRAIIVHLDSEPAGQEADGPVGVGVAGIALAVAGADTETTQRNVRRALAGLVTLGLVEQHDRRPWTYARPPTTRELQVRLRVAKTEVAKARRAVLRAEAEARRDLAEGVMVARQRLAEAEAATIADDWILPYRRRDLARAEAAVEALQARLGR